jgi:hypothetical protein
VAKLAIIFEGEVRAIVPTAMEAEKVCDELAEWGLSALALRVPEFETAAEFMIAFKTLRGA